MKIIISKNHELYFDLEDYETVNEYNWYAHKAGKNIYASGYLKGNRRSGLVLLHRLLLSPERGQDVDHIDKNGLNNCRKNIRICTRSQNNLNRNNKGYYFDKSKGRFRAETTYGGKKKYIGIYKTEEEARAAYLLHINNITDGFLSHVNN